MNDPNDGGGCLYDEDGFDYKNGEGEDPLNHFGDNFDIWGEGEDDDE